MKCCTEITMFINTKHAEIQISKMYIVCVLACWDNKNI